MSEAKSRSVAGPHEAAFVVAERLHKQAIRLLRRLRREDWAMGLHPARASVLSLLVFRGACGLGDLAAAEQVKPPTMSRIVAALVADGLVARAGDPRDGRAILLTATASGRRLLQRGKSRRLKTLVAMLAGLSRADLDILARAAGILERTID